MTDDIQEEEQERLSPEEKIAHVMEEFSGKEKEFLLPPPGAVFSLGPFTYKVVAQNIGDLRFSAKLIDFPVAGEPPEEESTIITQDKKLILPPDTLGKRH